MKIEVWPVSNQHYMHISGLLFYVLMHLHVLFYVFEWQCLYERWWELDESFVLDCPQCNDNKTNFIRLNLIQFNLVFWLSGRKVTFEKFLILSKGKHHSMFWFSLPPTGLLSLLCPLWALRVTRDAPSSGGWCQAGFASHREGQVISCSERPVVPHSCQCSQKPTSHICTPHPLCLSSFFFF